MRPRVLLAWIWAVMATHAMAQSAPTDTDLRDPEGFLRASPGRDVVLPRDHVSHPETRTEWWYLTGPLEGPDGEQFGFQATWFRRALVREQPAGRSPLAVRDVLLFHGVVIDVATGESSFHEQASRAYGPWAHASTERLDVAVFGDRLVDPVGDGRAAELVMDTGDARLELELELEAATPLFHGALPGLSIKGLEEGQASWYYTLPDIPVRGWLTRPGQERIQVTGRAWMDHEYGSSQLGPAQEGWDWFSTELDDGTHLMLYEMRLEGGDKDVTSSGTVRAPEATALHLTADDFSIEPTGSWTSDRSGIRYPSGWTLTVPSEELVLDVQPVVPDQELATPGTTSVTYWEGLCRFRGTRAGVAVEGEGYVELVGYGDPIADRFLAGQEGAQTPQQ